MLAQASEMQGFLRFLSERSQVSTKLTMEGNPVYDKALAFAIRVVRLYKYLNEEKREHVMSKQLLRSGTSIGANISESQAGESSMDFVHKLAISQKEIKETQYWLTLLCRTDYITEAQYQSMANDCHEIYKMITSIILSTKQKTHHS